MILSGCYYKSSFSFLSVSFHLLYNTKHSLYVYLDFTFFQTLSHSLPLSLFPSFICLQRKKREKKEKEKKEGERRECRGHLICFVSCLERTQIEDPTLGLTSQTKRQMEAIIFTREPLVPMRSPHPLLHQKKKEYRCLVNNLMNFLIFTIKIALTGNQLVDIVKDIVFQKQEVFVLNYLEEC